MILLQGAKLDAGPRLFRKRQVFHSPLRIAGARQQSGENRPYARRHYVLTGCDSPSSQDEGF